MNRFECYIYQYKRKIRRDSATLVIFKLENKSLFFIVENGELIKIACLNSREGTNPKSVFDYIYEAVNFLNNKSFRLVGSHGQGGDLTVKEGKRSLISFICLNTSLRIALKIYKKINENHKMIGA